MAEQELAKEEKIKFKQLNIWLRIAVIGGWLYVLILILSFLLGFFVGLMG